MSINSKYHQQAVTTAKKHGVNIEYLGQAHDTRPVIFLGSYSGESLTLARAITSICDDVRVILLYQDGVEGCLELRGNELGPAFLFSSTYTHNQYDGDSHFKTGNAYDIQRLTGDKFFTNFILAKNGISVPKNIRLIVGEKTIHETIDGEQSYSKINPLGDYLRKIDQRNEAYVLKSRHGCGGNGVLIVRDTSKDVNFAKITNIVREGAIIEELIASYPIEIEGVKKDWNLRVLVSYDPKTQKYITAGITGRIDIQGGPVNRSISADNISLEDLGELCGWSNDDFHQIKGEVERTAELSCEVLVQAGARKGNAPPYMNFQTLFGVDIIIDKDKHPIVIEVNDSDSGCMFELAELEGIEAIYPIARAVIHKTRLLQSIPGIIIFVKEISKQTGISDDTLIQIYNSGELIITEDSLGIHFDIPEKYLSGIGIPS